MISFPEAAPQPPRTAIVLARGGATGARETLRTLERLVEAWDAVPDWEVVLVAAPDPALEELLTALEGDVRARWDPAAVTEEADDARRRGRETHVLAAGDAAPSDGRSGPLRVPLVDEQFTGISGSYLFAESDGSGVLRWDKDVDPSVRHPVVVFTNLSVHQIFEYRAAHRVAWLLESPEVYPHTTEFVLEHVRHYDLVVTNDLDLLQRLPRGAHVPAGGCWIPPHRQRVAVKSRWCSMIASKKATTSGHRARLRMVELARDAGVHLFGRDFDGVDGFGELTDKADGLVMYQYSVAVENCRVRGYFSEKLIDCFRTGTIPVYWGDPAIADVFDPDGMLIVEHEDDLPRVLARATPEHYEQVRPAVEENFRRAEAYRGVEDRLYPLLAPLAGHSGHHPDPAQPGPRTDPGGRR